MNQPTSQRPGDDSSKKIVPAVFGAQFSPGGPLADPDDLDGLDFGMLGDLVSPAESAPAAAVEPQAEAPQVVSREESWNAISWDTDDTVEAKVDAPNEVAPSVPKARIPASLRVRVPRDDDDDGFGSGLLEAFDDDDSDESLRPASTNHSAMDVPDNDDDIIDEPPVKSSASGDFDAESEDDSVDAASGGRTAPKKNDDFWDALEGWDWEVSEEGGDGARRSGGARGGRPERAAREERPRRERHPSGAAPAGNESARDERPRRTEAASEKPAREPKHRERPARPEREAAPATRERVATTDAPKRESRSSGRDRGGRSRTELAADKAPVLDVGDGFADDLFDRLGETSRRPTKRLDELEFESASSDEPLAADDSVDTRGPRGDDEDAPRSRNRRRRRRGRKDSADAESVVPDREFDDEDSSPVDEGDDDGFGEGLGSPRRSSSRRPVRDTADAERRPARPDAAPSARRQESAPSRREESASRRPETRRERSEDDQLQDRPPRGERQRPASREEEPRRERSRDDRDSRDRDREPAAPRTERALREERSSRDDRSHGEREERPRREAEPARRTPRGRNEDRADRGEESARPKPEQAEVPTWEHAISLLVRRPPRQDRSGPPRDDQGSRGRGRRRSNEG